jgi:type II secretory ATPase GspE/PulE/Tfp pilus assembly ATPase PilB-like protein
MSRLDIAERRKPQDGKIKIALTSGRSSFAWRPSPPRWGTRTW